MTAVVMRDNIASLRRIREFAEHYRADDLNLSHIIPNRADDVEQALWPMCDVAAIKAVTDKISYSRRFEPLDMGTQIPMFKFSERYKDLLFPDEESLQEAELFSWKGKPVTRRTNWCRFVEEGHCFIRWDGDVSHSSMRPACSAAAASCWKKTRPTASAPSHPPAAAACGARALPCVRNTKPRVLRVVLRWVPFLLRESGTCDGSFYAGCVWARYKSDEASQREQNGTIF